MNPYEILGVDKNASAEEIKKAYRKLSKEHHPDKGGNEDKFKEIASAYDTLSNPEKKQQYDTFGEGGNPFGGRGGAGDPFGGFEDFISQMFGGNPMNRQRNKRGSDVTVSVQMSLMDVMLGANKKVTYTKDVKCEPCDGKGGEDVSKCMTCNGNGQTMRAMQTPIGYTHVTQTCHTCNGSGTIVKNPCVKCKGSGVFPKVETVDVHIPAGVANGMQLTMQGAGNSIREGINGDLQVRIQEIADNNFKREGNHLHNDLWITISEAVLGTKKTVKAPLGDISFNIDAGCDSGKVFTFTNKGVPNLSQDGRSYGNGNLYVKVNVTIPKKVTAESKALFEELKNHELI
jgi:molecular chaperone DnaJ